MTNDSTSRFSNRVGDYVKYRPGYPTEIVSWLQQHYNFAAVKTIADIGSGTGISSVLFLKAGYALSGIEPNKEMREMSIQLLQEYPLFKAVNGTAEATTLKDNSVDAIISGQAFHWFDTGRAKPEFKRILRPGGPLVLIWNERLTDTAFEKEYDKLITKHGRNYVQVDHRNIGPENISSFFQPQPYELKTFPNKQVFDFNGVKGRLLSSSYMPALNEPGYGEMIHDLLQLFDQHKEDGVISITYTTKVYAGIF